MDIKSSVEKTDFTMFVTLPFMFLLTASATLAAPTTPSFDPNGQQNVGNGKGGQFIGGQCLSVADCASACCAGPFGVCSGPLAANQDGKTGCGFVSGSSPPSVAAPPPQFEPQGYDQSFDNQNLHGPCSCMDGVWKTCGKGPGGANGLVGDCAKNTLYI